MGPLSFPIQIKAEVKTMGWEGRKSSLMMQLRGLFSQTDDDWCAIVVVNSSPGKKATEYLNFIRKL